VSRDSTREQATEETKTKKPSTFVWDAGLSSKGAGLSMAAALFAFAAKRREKMPAASVTGKLRLPMILHLAIAPDEQILDCWR